LLLSDQLDRLYKYLNMRETGPALATIASILEEINIELEDLKDRIRELEQNN